MIVRMKKVTVLTLERHRAETLRALSAIGVVHPQAVASPHDEALEKTRHAYQDLEKLVAALRIHAAEQARTRPPRSDAAARRTASGQAVSEDAAIIATIRQDLEESKTLADRIQNVAREIRDAEPLGDFDPQAVRDLEGRGIMIRLLRHAGHETITPSNDAVLRILRRDRHQTIYAWVGAGDPPGGDQPIALPARPLRAMREEAAEMDRRLSACNHRLSDATVHLPRMEQALARRSEALRIAEAHAGMGGRETIRYLQGYCPAEKLDTLRAAAQQHGWSLLIENPAGDDPVPTLIRHPAWTRPIRSVLNLMGILPGYREIDVSAAFLLFFSLFFAMIVGDAGYGLIFLGLTAVARRRWKDRAPPEPFRLLFILSVSTVVWGLLTGNVFGTRWFPTLVPWLDQRENLMLLCFFIGAVHLSIAHAWNAITILNTPQALAQAGWIALTWTMFLAARSLILGAAFPALGSALLIGGLLLVVVFMTPPRLFKTEWVNHAMLPLTVINNFVDVVSYVRLFAVGYASLAVAQAFNNMAMAEEMGIARGLVAALILFVGHTLNMVLCGLSVLVHGIRLNTLEFSGHIGMQWTGFAYRPLAREAAAAENGDPLSSDNSATQNL